MIIAVDFDGTLVSHRFPKIGQEAPHAFRYLREFQEAGARLILYTMRSDFVGDNSPEFPEVPGGPYLTEAVEYCRARGIEFWGVNANPEQASWTASPKPYAHLYIDDAAFGCPLRAAVDTDRPIVAWESVGPAVLQRMALEAQPA